MKSILLAMVVLVGCSSPGPIVVQEYDAGAGESSSASSSSGSQEPSCIPIGWNFGDDRFCEQCVCPGTECRTKSLGEELVVGVCGADLECSTPCNDPMWIEMQSNP